VRALALTLHDIRLQFRHGFYYAYLVVSFFYAAIIAPINGPVRDEVWIVVLFSDPSLLGFYFLGGIILLERGQNTISSLFISPVKIVEYILAKVLSLTLLAFMTCLIVTLLTRGFDFNLLLLIVAVLFSSTLFILFGFSAAAKARSINHYFMISSLGYSVFFILPFLDRYGVLESPLWILHPSNASLIMFESVIHPMPVLIILRSLLILTLWIIPVGIWAYRWFRDMIVYGGAIR